MDGQSKRESALREDERTGFQLASRDPRSAAPVLAGVQGRGRLEGALLDFVLRQVYRNTGDELLEVVYTFPLPHPAVLMGFASELAGVRKEGEVVARADAERQYESSLAEGDLPVMLETDGNGLHTANLGNLKPGDEIALEVRFVQPLDDEGGRTRLVIPTTIAPRYGEPQRAGLQPQQVPTVDLGVTYPLELSIVVGASLVGEKVSSPTHRFEVQRLPDGEMSFELSPGARLDRDVVLTVEKAGPAASKILLTHDDRDPAVRHVAMAVLRPAIAGRRERVAVKALVDCSGSMGGDSIASARRALHGLVERLGDEDELALSRFGSSVEHLLRPTRLTPRGRRLLGPTIDSIDADLGGTEMAEALRAVFELDGKRHPESEAGSAGEPRGNGRADVLLITDGEIWQVDELIAMAGRSGHRVFAIGVGSSPAEPVLRRLALATGGACEFATPGEKLEAAAARMLDRMRQVPLSNVRFEWSGGAPAWQVASMTGVFDGDTVTAFAGLQDPAHAATVRLLADEPSGRTITLAIAEGAAAMAGDGLCRLAASHRLAAAPEPEVVRLALRYQLMSRHTNCILTHVRAEGEKADGEVTLHKVPSMLAAGWGGMGTLKASYSQDIACMSMPAPESPVRFSRSRSASASSDVGGAVAEFDGRPGYSAKELSSAAGEKAGSFDEVAVVETVVAWLQSHGGASGLANACSHLTLPDFLERALHGLESLGLEPDVCWLLLAQWIDQRHGGVGDGYAELLQSHLESARSWRLSKASRRLSKARRWLERGAIS